MFDFQSLIKYVLEGLAVAVAAYLIPRKTVDPMEIGIIALTAAAVFAILDQFAPLVASGARQGAGFGIGFHQIGMGQEAQVGAEFFEGVKKRVNGDSGNANANSNANASGDPKPALESPVTQKPALPTTQKPTPTSTSNQSGVCGLNGQTCGYNPSATLAEREHYMCQIEPAGKNTKCKAMKACYLSDHNECTLSKHIKNNIENQSCQLIEHKGKKTCRLMSDHPIEDFIVGDAGFEGFTCGCSA